MTVKNKHINKIQYLIESSRMTNSLKNRSRTITIEITGRCNLNCDFCYYHGSRNFEMEFNDFCEYALKKKSDGFGTFVLTGGEPFSHNNIFEIIDFLGDNGLKCYIITNGTRLDEDNILRIKNRVDKIILSVSGLEPDKYDSISNAAGTTEKKIMALKLLKRYNIPTTINLIIFRNNFRNLLDTVKRILEYYPDIRHFSFIYYRIDDAGSGKENNAYLVPYSVSSKFIVEAFEFLKSRNKEFTISDVPPCFLGEFRDSSKNNIMKYPNSNIYVSNRVEKDLVIEYVKSDPCTRCRLNSECAGISRYYFNILGDAEIKHIIPRHTE